MSPHNHRTDRLTKTRPLQGGRSSRPSKTKVCQYFNSMPRVSPTPNSKSYDSSPITLNNWRQPKTTRVSPRGSIPSKHHGMATFVRTGITWSAVKQYPPDSNIEWLVTEVQETTIVNVYKLHHLNCIRLRYRQCLRLCRWLQLPAHRLGL